MSARQEIVFGDCLELMRTMRDASVDAVVTDPPYGLGSIPDIAEVLRHWLAGDDYVHTGGGFMGKTWDSFVPGPSIWREVFRVLKPGGHALIFAGSRTVDIMGMAVRLAGFEIRDQAQWLYGSGFPKSLDVSKQIDKAAGAEREVIKKIRIKGGGMEHVNRTNADEQGYRPDGYQKGENILDITAPATDAAKQWSGWGTALKPAHEPIILARKPLDGTVIANVLTHGTGALNIDGCRIATDDKMSFSKAAPYTDANGVQGRTWNPTSTPGMEREQSALGRWPANVIFDEEAGAALDEQSGMTKSTGGKTSGTTALGQGSGWNAHENRATEIVRQNDSGGASRFFYCAKTSASEREAGLDHLPKKSAGELTDRNDGTDGLKSPRAGAGRTSDGRANVHPTVKPISLMRYLCKLITPPGGIVIDPFAGSGTTGCAAALEDFNFIGFEKEAEYAKIAEARIAHWRLQVPDGADVHLEESADVRAEQPNEEDHRQVHLHIVK